MARIRSVHPGLFTDEAFMDLSCDAQIFLIGLWTEADDQGVFEWKPSTLRARLRPTKDGSADNLLFELSEANCIRSYEIGGRKFGAIRNFRKYQRPKKPNSVHVITPEIGNYVALSASSSEPDDAEDEASSEPVTVKPATVPPKSEISPQMEDGGGRMKEGGDKPSLRSEKRARESGSLDLLLDWIPQEPWAAFLEMRRKIRKPPTDRAKDLLIAELDKLRKQGHDPTTVLNQSVMNNWQGLFPIKPENGNGTTRNGFNGHGTSNLVEGTRRAVERAQREDAVAAGIDHD